MKEDNLVVLVILAIISGLFGCASGPDQDGAVFAWESPQLGIGMLPGPLSSYVDGTTLDVSGHQMLDVLEHEGLDRGLMVDVLASARVEVRAGKWVCLGGTPYCAGETLDFKLIVQATPCVWDSALRHEMAHLLLGYVTGNYDAGHTRAFWPATTTHLGECL